MSYNSLSNIGNVANISKKNLPSPTSLAYYTGAASTSITETTGNISFSIATIAGSTTYISNFGNGSGTPTLYTISNLASNTPYGITLTAINSGNKSAPSTPFSILTKPAAPTSVAYVVGSATTVTGNVSFTAPTGTGVITSYIPSFGGVTGTTSPLNVTGLSINTSYSFTLKAANATGNSVDSSPAITLLTLPGPPTSLAYVANSATVNAVNVSFTAPTGNGVITGYIPSNGGVTGTASPITVSTLTSNTSYSFTMKSTNASGNSVDSSPALPILTLPDPPTALTYSATNLTTSSFSIAFTAPSGTGIITGYVPSSGGGTGTTSPFTVTGLASNTSYTITLRAKNASGNSAVSATSVTKLTLPDAPTIGTATVVNSTSVSVSFTAPGGTGSITSYTVTSSPGSFTGTGSTSPITVTAAFVSATAYTFTVTATNASGTSAASTATSPSVTPNNYDGSTSASAAPSAAFLAAAGNTTNGVYWINLPTVGATQVYCILDRAVDGGGWMMAMKATTGTTFNYYANYWTTANILTPTDTTRNDADAKFHTMNYSLASDLLALWPDISGNSTTGGSLFLTDLKYVVPSTNYKCWTWLQNRFTSAGTFYIGGNSATTTTVTGITASMTLIDWFNKLQTATVTTGSDGARCFIQDASMWTGWNAAAFSSQTDVRFYGFNYYNTQGTTNGTRTRWGFGWNENGGGLFPGGNMDSDDVFGGIGTWGNQQLYNAIYHYSAGDGVGCCQNSTGVNRSARVEMYIRDSANAPSAPTIGTVTKNGTTVTVPFTVVTGASYYTAFSNKGGFYGSSTTTPITITGVAAGTYTFTVKASNANGTSLASGISSITV